MATKHLHFTLRGRIWNKQEFVQYFFCEPQARLKFINIWSTAPLSSKFFPPLSDECHLEVLEINGRIILKSILNK